MKWEKCLRCNNCGAIYSCAKSVCKKCGAELSRLVFKTPFEDCIEIVGCGERVIAYKKWGKWTIQEKDEKITICSTCFHRAVCSDRDYLTENQCPYFSEGAVAKLAQYKQLESENYPRGISYLKFEERIKQYPVIAEMYEDSKTTCLKNNCQSYDAMFWETIESVEFALEGDDK